MAFPYSVQTKSKGKKEKNERNNKRENAREIKKKKVMLVVRNLRVLTFQQMSVTCEILQILTNPVKHCRWQWTKCLD